MNVVNSITTSVFDVVLTPLEWMGPEVAVAVLSGAFGVLGLFIFKYISWQKGIRAAKDKIKGHMIEIRIYQDDLVVVSQAVAKVLMRNVQYLFLNLLPFVPLSVPFVLLLAQFVVRYAFEPLPEGERFDVVVELAQENAGDVPELEIVGPDWARDSALANLTSADGRAFFRIDEAPAGTWELEFRVGDDGPSATKRIVIGEERDRTMQAERVGSFWLAWLWPAEPMFEGESPFRHIVVDGGYPERELRWLPNGLLGILTGVLIFSFALGLAALKPLGVTI